MNISPVDIEIDVWAYAYYSCLRTATMTDSDSQREVQFSVPSGSSWENQYTIHWSGSCVLQHLYTPDGSDILQLEKQHVYDYFKWGFVYVSFNPTALASRYGFDEEGLWTIQMEIVDSAVPSLYAPGGFRVSIHRHEWTHMTKNLAIGESYTLNLPSVPNWYGEGFSYGLTIYANSSQVDVSDALLEYSYHSVSGTSVYDYSYWRPYNQTVVITNVWTEPLSIDMYFYTRVFRNIDHEVDGEGLRFTLDSVVFDQSRASYYLSLDIAVTIPLNSSALYVPTGNKAEDVYRNVITSYSDEYYTLETIYGIHGVSFNPYHTWKVLENDVYGTWRLRLEMPEGNHDIALTDIEPYRTVVAVNSSTDIDVTVANQGNFVETFNVTVYEDSQPIINRTLTLDGGESRVLNFVWNATVPMITLPGNCTLLATASTVQNETHTENNDLACCIKISIRGDIDSNGKVDILDIATAAKAFGAKLGDERWNANPDVNEDRKIDILDIETIAEEFGKTA